MRSEGRTVNQTTGVATLACGVVAALLLAGGATADVRALIQDHATACGYTAEDVEVLVSAAEVYATGGEAVEALVAKNVSTCQPADQLAQVLIMGAKEERPRTSPTAAASDRIEPDLTTPELPPDHPPETPPEFATLLDPGEAILDPTDNPSPDFRLTPAAYADVDTRLPRVNPFPELPDLPFHDLILIDGFPLLLPDLPFIRILPVNHQELLVPGELIVAGIIPTGTLAARVAIASHFLAGTALVGISGNTIDRPQLPLEMLGLVDVKNVLGLPRLIPQFPLWKALPKRPDLPFVKVAKVGLHDSPIGLRLLTPDFPFGDIDIPFVNKRGSFHGIPILEPDIPFISLDLPFVDEVADAGGFPLLAPTIPLVPPLLRPFVDKVGEFGGLPVYVPDLPLLPSSRIVSIAERIAHSL